MERAADPSIALSHRPDVRTSGPTASALRSRTTVPRTPAAKAARRCAGRDRPEGVGSTTRRPTVPSLLLFSWRGWERQAPNHRTAEVRGAGTAGTRAAAPAAGREGPTASAPVPRRQGTGGGDHRPSPQAAIGPTGVMPMVAQVCAPFASPIDPTRGMPTYTHGRRSTGIRRRCHSGCR